MKEIDWEERYFEMVKAIITGKLVNEKMPNNLSKPDVVKQILNDAKKVIEALREKAYLIKNETPD